MAYLYGPHPTHSSLSRGSCYTQVADNINVMAEEGAAMDESKERTLEEISMLVKDVTNQLKERRITLAPEIKKLREFRKEYMDVRCALSSPSPASPALTSLHWLLAGGK